MISAPWPVKQVETEKRRLEILRCLNAAPEYTLQAPILRQHCVAMGIPSTNDQVAAALEWLEEQELACTRRTMARVLVATLTARGAEVATGAATTAGVARPLP
ncbi:VpaChn25_0724 family phage protein [Pseudaestuariivita sp.]|uniref:VpaChn25_0724 family phage protein n=1 Tax=Pseudaestuariivita sp. TaxID=2211669 RepID=UPI004057F15C